MEQAYEGTSWLLEDDFDSRRCFEIALSRIDVKSSPGYPYLREAPTNGDWLGWDGAWFDLYKVERLWFDVQKVLRKDWELYLRVFVKSEPHKAEKVKVGRWRLIMASPLPVQIVWHMLFDKQNDIEIRKAYDIPSQQGITLVGGDWKRFRELWLSNGFDAGLDKRAWDWTMPWWKIQLCLEFRYRMSRGSRKQQWYELASWLYRGMFGDPILVLSDGRLYKQLYPGIMKSGCVNTISDNSHGQIIDHILVCEDLGVDYNPLPVACGDDTLQRMGQVHDVAAYGAYGSIVKSASMGLEFVGHDFLATGPQPLYFAKHLKKLERVKDEHLPEYFDSMLRLYAYSPLKTFWREMAYRLDCWQGLLSDEAYLYWYGYSE